MLAGANLIYGAGMLELGQTVSLEQLVIDNEIIGMCKKATRGIAVNEETIALDVIKTVKYSGNFITQNHTRKYMKEEQSFPILINREMRGAWEKKGKKDLTAVAHDKVKEILRTHEVPPIDKDIKEDILKIIRSVDKRV
jgi:trimethylamine--corrinoid protein Co-methyltransferase